MLLSLSSWLDPGFGWGYQKTEEGEGMETERPCKPTVNQPPTHEPPQPLSPDNDELCISLTLLPLPSSPSSPSSSPSPSPSPSRTNRNTASLVLLFPFPRGQSPFLPSRHQHARNPFPFQPSSFLPPHHPRLSNLLETQASAGMNGWRRERSNRSNQEDKQGERGWHEGGTRLSGGTHSLASERTCICAYNQESSSF
ncbi:hypothetical protein IE53DRAFT_5298 [Violaceomyces palustris]|uniref:Uncharacterized protein n=1 Tax=Violaceomyces palustris TaxID=1673888 RepID=A0ACD0NM03_9BASI|nr:hypothetical protein IE53DRAFT_5298 [Violaceomyces palustris]